MAVKYQRDTDPAKRTQTVRLGLTPFRRQARVKEGRHPYRLALLYFAVFGVIVLSFANTIVDRNTQRANAPRTGTGRIVALEAPQGDTTGDAMGVMKIAFPAEASEPAMASWEVPLELWDKLALDDVVAVRYEGGANQAYRLLDAGYVALPEVDAID